MDFIKDPTIICQNVYSYLRRKGFWGVTFPEEDNTNKERLEAMFERQGFIIKKQQRFFGYKDSSSGVEVFYRGYLLEKKQ
jgi:hypothetical protein